MVQLLSSRGMALLKRAGPRAASSNRSCKLVVRAFQNGSEHQSRSSTKQLGQEQHNAELKEQAEANGQAKVQFQLPHHVEWGQDVCLVGEAAELGAWDVGKCIPMAWHDGDVWTAEAQLQQGAHVEYKYVVREGEGQARDVVEWQPCMNLGLTAQQGQITVRDAWEGEHEVHPGMLPVPPPPAAKEEAAEEEDPTPAAAEAAAALPDAPAPVAPAVLAAPAGEQQQLLQLPVVVEVAGAAALPVAPASVGGQQPPVLTAEEIAASEAGAEAAPAAPAVLSSSSSSKAEVAAQVLGPAADEMAARIRQPRKGVATPTWLAEKPSKRKQTPQTTSAAVPDATPKRKVSVADLCTEKKVSLADLPTSELKSMCKQRGLSIKGQRQQLVQRLQLHKA